MLADAEKINNMKMKNIKCVFFFITINYKIFGNFGHLAMKLILFVIRLSIVSNMFVNLVCDFVFSNKIKK